MRTIAILKTNTKNNFKNIYFIILIFRMKTSATNLFWMLVEGLKVMAPKESWIDFMTLKFLKVKVMMMIIR